MFISMLMTMAFPSDPGLSLEDVYIKRENEDNSYSTSNTLPTSHGPIGNPNVMGKKSFGLKWAEMGCMGSLLSLVI